MFANKSIVALFLIGSFGFSAHAAPPLPANSEGSPIEEFNEALLPRHYPSFPSHGSSVQAVQTEVSTFFSSWETLSQSFSQCQSAISERSSITVVKQSVQRLYANYQAVLSQYNSCAACGPYLTQSSYNNQIRQSVTEMYTCFQSIVSTCQEYYHEEWQSYFAKTFQSMSTFGQFSQNVCSSAGINFQELLGGIHLNNDIFARLGINLGLGRLSGGPVGGHGGNGLLDGFRG